MTPADPQDQPLADGLSERLAKARNAEALLHVIEVLQVSDVMTEGIGHVLDICRQVPGADLVVLLRGAADETMETVAVADHGFGLPRWNLPFEQAAYLGYVRDVRDSGLHGMLPAQAQQYRSLVSALIADDNEQQLLLIAMKAEADGYSFSDASLLTRIATQVRHALDHQRTKHHLAKLELVLSGSNGADGAATAEEQSFEVTSNAFSQLEMWQARILRIIDDLLRATAAELDAAIDRALEALGELSDSDRAYVFRLSPTGRLDNTHEWTAPCVQPMIEVLQDQPVELMEDWLPSFDAGLPVYIADVDQLPEESSTREVLQMQDIRSLLAVPMHREGKITGFVGLDAVRKWRKFRPMELRLLLSIGNTIGAVIDRHTAEAEARRATADLEAESSQLRATLASLPDTLLMLDSDGRFVDYSTGGSEAAILLPEGFIGRLVDDVLPPDKAEFARAIMRDVDKNGKSHGNIFSMNTPSGEKWFSCSAGSRRIAGKADGYAFLIRDVTQRYLQQRQIRSLGRIAELTSNLVIVTDAEGLITWVNPAFEKRSGWKLDAVLGQKPGDLLQFDATDQSVIAAMRERLAKAEPVRTEVLNRSRFGEEYWISKDIQPLLDDFGRLEGFVSIQTDITEMKTSHHYEQQLRNKAIEAASDGICIVDADERFLLMNSACRKMFGIPAGLDIQNLTTRDLMAPGEAADLVARIWPILKEKKRWRGDVLGRHWDGHLMDLHVTIAVSEDGKIVSVVRDITEERRVEAERTRLREQLELAQREATMAQVASGVAHDLTNLVAVVSGTVETLTDAGGVSDAFENGLRRIRLAMETAHSLVRGLVDMGRPNDPRIEIDLRTIVLEAIDLLGTHRVRRYSVHTELPPSAQLVKANRTELLQVLVNLALNACEAEGDHRNHVTLTVFPEGTPVPARSPDTGVFDPNRAYAIFTVSDTGTGIPDELRKNLFERYVSTKGSAGTGLGLPIVASILRNAPGGLWVDSTPNAGTTMTVAWPTGGENGRLHPAEAFINTSRADLSGLYIMVVDDNVDHADMLSELIEARGGITATLSDPAEAQALLIENSKIWSALVTDHDMPGISGSQLAEVAAACEPPVPCVLVSAHTQHYQWDTALFSSVHAKPVNTDAFLAGVANAVRGTQNR